MIKLSNAPAIALSIVILLATPGINSHCAPSTSPLIDTRRITYKIRDHGLLVLHVPINWNDSIDRPEGSPFPTIHFHAFDDDAFKIMITPMVGTRDDYTSPETLRAIVHNVWSALDPEPVEKKIDVKQIGGSSTHGFYFTAEDSRAPLPEDEYRYMTQGCIAVGDLLVVFTILTQEKNSRAIVTAIELLTNAKHIP